VDANRETVMLDREPVNYLNVVQRMGEVAGGWPGELLLQKRGHAEGMGRNTIF
jgi:hypothetical protein